MKVLKFILGLVAAGVLLVGGFAAGTFITQLRTANMPAQQIAQPTFIPHQQIQPTIVLPQLQVTPAPQTTPPVIPPQGQWGRDWWMMNPNYAPQGQQGWDMHDGDYENWNGMQGRY